MWSVQSRRRGALRRGGKVSRSCCYAGWTHLVVRRQSELECHYNMLCRGVSGSETEMSEESYVAGRRRLPPYPEIWRIWLRETTTPTTLALFPVRTITHTYYTGTRGRGRAYSRQSSTTICFSFGAAAALWLTPCSPSCAQRRQLCAKGQLQPHQRRAQSQLQPHPRPDCWAHSHDAA